MKYKKKLLTTIMLFGLAGITSLQAQVAFATTGGEASSSKWSCSFTIGQVVYTTQIGAKGNSVAQGVQQPIEISIVKGTPDANDISLSVSVYPNPATDYLAVRVGNYESAALQYQVFDIHGNLLQTVKAEGNETRIRITHLLPANYFVKVLDNKKVIKVFKIIKN